MSEDAPRLAQAAIRTGHQVMETGSDLGSEPTTENCPSTPKSDP